MTGLFIRELIVRGDLRRCLIVAPGSLVEQWQAELAEKFHLDFTLLTRDRIEGSASGNPFAESDLLIARLDKLSRDEDLQLILEQRPRLGPHRLRRGPQALGPAVLGDEVKKTKRRLLGGAGPAATPGTSSSSPPRRTTARRRTSSCS